jgi:hypothetical protein
VGIGDFCKIDIIDVIVSISISISLSKGKIVIESYIVKEVLLTWLIDTFGIIMKSRITGSNMHQRIKGKK